MLKKIYVADPVADAEALRKATPGISDSIIQQAKSIMDSVAQYGDPAIQDYTMKFDGVQLTSLKVTDSEIKQAYGKVTKGQISSIKEMKKRLEKTEQALLKRLNKISITSDGVRIKRTIQPISSIGCYIPGGKARYPSTAVMCAVPAKVAGVKRIVAVSPPLKDGSIDPLTLVAADICGVDEFYKMGGAQAIAGLTYGTQGIKKVSKIVGPGGMFVTAAKVIASSAVSTDMVAGPTELIVYADGTADPKIVALDLISQAEHSTDTVCGLVTTSVGLADKVEKEIQSITQSITRSDIVRKSLQDNGFAAVCKNVVAAVEFINEFAPEHLEIISKNPHSVADQITSAGLVLIGEYTPSSASDYCLGSNHVLPTLGFGKSRASLSVLDFIKIVNRVEATKVGLKKIDLAVKEVASAEGLINHYEAVKERTRGKNEEEKK